MNCKPGDIAMYVGPVEEVRGAVVLIVRADPRWPGAWIHKPSLPAAPEHLDDSAWDKHLKPLRNSDATDEMIELLGKPVREGETV